ncbi:hypothetical protein [Rhizobium sp. 'Codium 1']|uniref:hypothetical protein n=1 Tax=Rhizobium sp. 'Codium 1' TaxID=2940484 RepID=UPI001E45BD36|nr:hypothetical protein [Rhizobium sp. 'Codium 1']MCC8931854.1 hypothetical protein [Rhizobium sp. 'Codium 1']
MNQEQKISYLRSFRQHYAEYHNHKEAMAFSVFALEGAFFLGFVVLNSIPQDMARLGRETLIPLAGIVWILFHLVLRFQFRNRRVAALLVEAAFLAEQDVLQNAEVKKVERRTPSLDLDRIDTWLFPVKTTFRKGDVDFDEVFPELGSRVIEASNKGSAGGKYGILPEYITTFGSFFLLFIIVLRLSGFD